MKNLWSNIYILVLVINIMFKSLLLKVLELLYKDNLIKCDTISNFIYFIKIIKWLKIILK